MTNSTKSGLLFFQIIQGKLIYTRTSLAGSIIGGIKETQDCIDFCHKKNIKPAIELITKEKLSEVYKKLEGKNDAVIRYVLDVEKSLKM